MSAKQYSESLQKKNILKTKLGVGVVIVDHQEIKGIICRIYFYYASQSVCSLDFVHSYRISGFFRLSQKWGKSDKILICVS